jgi:hypothetical protein
MVGHKKLAYLALTNLLALGGMNSGEFSTAQCVLLRHSSPG